MVHLEGTKTVLLQDIVHKLLSAFVWEGRMGREKGVGVSVLPVSTNGCQMVFLFFMYTNSP